MTRTEEINQDDIIRRINATLDSLSKGQQKVVEFMLKQGIEGLYMSSTRIADVVGVNRSTVVRTAQALGYPGFTDFQTALQDHFSRQFGSVDLIDIGTKQLRKDLDGSNPADLHAVLRHMVLNEIQKLTTVPDLIPAADFERAVDLLVGARSVAIIGLHLSKALALNFLYPLRLLRQSVFLLEPETIDYMRILSSLDEKAVLFTISNNLYSREALRCMEYARDVGATVITLTDSAIGPPARRADLALVIPAGLWFYGNSAVPFTVLNALCAAVLLRNPTPPPDLSKVEQAFQQFDMFVGNKGEE
jgi:DNA-binding MurR/RpiR family transcriptional regulator